MMGYNSSNGEWCQSCEEWKKSICHKWCDKCKVWLDSNKHEMEYNPLSCKKCGNLVGPKLRDVK